MTGSVSQSFQNARKWTSNHFKNVLLKNCIIIQYNWKRLEFTLQLIAHFNQEKAVNKGFWTYQKPQHKTFFSVDLTKSPNRPIIDLYLEYFNLYPKEKNAIFTA